MTISDKSPPSSSPDNDHLLHHKLFTRGHHQHRHVHSTPLSSISTPPTTPPQSPGTLNTSTVPLTESKDDQVMEVIIYARFVIVNGEDLQSKSNPKTHFFVGVDFECVVFI